MKKKTNKIFSVEHYFTLELKKFIMLIMVVVALLLDCAKSVDCLQATHSNGKVGAMEQLGIEVESQGKNREIVQANISNEFYKAILSDNETIISNFIKKGIFDEMRNYKCKIFLKYSMENCCINAVKHLLIECKNITFECGYTILHIAIANEYYENGTFIRINTENCYTEMITIYILSGQNVNTQTDKKQCNGSSPLHLAAQLNKVEGATLLLEHKANIELKDRFYRTPLFISAEYGSIDVMNLLIRSNATVNAYEDIRLWYPIHVAAQHGHTATIEVLLTAGANIEQESAWYNRRPIHQATLYNQLQTLEQLIQKGADVNASDLWGRSSLYLAVECDNVNATKILIEAKANVNSEMRERRTPLTKAVSSENYDLFSLLLESGANVHAKTNDGRTLLHYAARGGKVKIVEELLNLIPEAISIRDVRGTTPIYSAARTGCLNLLKVLISSGADPCVRSEKNFTLLHAAAENGKQDIAAEILKYPIDINAKDNEGQTALYKAAYYGTQEYFLYLLKRGADPNILTNTNETLIHSAAKHNGNGSILNLVLNISKASINAKDVYGISPMYSAAKNGRYAAFEILFDNGADPNIADNRGDTFLHWAAHFRNDKIINKILNKTISIEVYDKEGRTPIFIAAEKGHGIIFFLLVRKNASINICTKGGSNMIHAAAQGGNTEITKYVLNITKNINSQDGAGKTALFISADNSNTNLFHYLLEHGADMKIKTLDNITLLHAAVRGGNVQITQTVLKNTGLLNQCDKYGKPPIFYAVEQRKHDIFNILLQQGADTSPTSNGWTLLHSAAKNRDLILIDKALKITKNVNAQDNQGKTALFVSAENLQARSFSYLLENKTADPDIAKFDGTTILHFASHFGEGYFANKILGYSVLSVNKQDSGGRSPLHWAVYHNRIRLVPILLKHKADVTLETVYGYTPLMIAAVMGTESMIRQFDSFDYNGEALLGVALAWNNRKVISYLLQNKVTPTEENKIHFAAARGDNRELKVLLQSHNKTSQAIRFSDIMSEITKEYQKFTIAMEDDDIYIINPLNFNLSPLDMAVFFNGSLDTVQLIIMMNNGSAINFSRNKKRWTLLDMAAYSGKEEIVKFFLKTKFPTNIIEEDSWTPMHKAAWGGHSSIIELLYKNNFDINVEDELGRTPLHVAALRGFKITVEKILKLNDSSLNKRDRYHFTPMHLAEIYGHPKFFEELAKMTVTMDSKSRYKIKDPGHIAGLRNFTGTVELLLAEGADCDSADRVFGWTALHWAAAIGDIQIAEMLVNKGASINLPSKLDQTPMYLARFWGRKDVYNFFKELNGVW